MSETSVAFGVSWWLVQQVLGLRGKAKGPAWANRMVLTADENLSERGHHRLAGVFAADDPTGSLQAAWQVKVEADNTAIKHIKRTVRGYRNPDTYKSRILVRSAARMAA